MTDLRALITQLCDELDHNRRCLLDDRRLTHPLADKARAALAEPEPEGPTDEENLELMPQQFQDDLATVSRMAAHGAGEDIKSGVFRVSLNTGALDFARAVIARWGNHPGSPDSSLQPISVSERLPGPGDRNSDGKCWWFCFECPGEHSYWILAKEVYCDPTYWFPAHAVPLPIND